VYDGRDSDDSIVLVVQESFISEAGHPRSSLSVSPPRPESSEQQETIKFCVVMKQTVHNVM